MSPALTGIIFPLVTPAGSSLLNVCAAIDVTPELKSAVVEYCNCTVKLSGT
jgi:hypothetical protein